MAILTVGQNKQYATLTTALNAARDGDTVQVSAGVYVNDLATVRTKVTITAVGGQAVLLATTPLASGQALLTVNTDATISGFIFAGAKSADGTAAGLLVTGGTLVVKNSLFTGNQTGLLAQGSATGRVTVQASEFAGNGANDGFSGNVVVGALASLSIQGSYIHDAVGGDEVRSRAKATTITGTRIIDNAAASTGDVVLPNGGVVLLQNNVIQKGVLASGAAIRLGGETVYAGTSLSLTGNTIVTDKAGTTLLQNATSVTASLAGNTLYGFSTTASGPASLTGNTVPSQRPSVSAAPLITPTTALPVEYGRAGAVVANGTILTVGAGGRYATLAAALDAARDGDTIRVAAGTYTEAAVTITRKVIIEGTGGIARLVATTPANGLAQIVTTTDVTLRNIEVTGAALPGGVAAAIRDQGGNLTLVNSFIHDNQAGIVADRATAGSVAIYDTELARNGTPDGRGANLDVAEVGTLTLRNDWIHDAYAGAEIRSHADNTTIDATRILQSAGVGAAAIELPNAGRVSVTGSAIEKGVGSLGGALIHVGGDTIYAGSTATISGTTLITDVTAAPTRFVAAETGAGTVALSGDTFVGGATGSVQALNATNTGAVVRTGLVAAATAPWGAAGAPAAGAVAVAAPVQAAASRGIMTLMVSGDAYRGNARFSLFVDGAQVGGTLTATAVHGAGQSQAFTVAGDFAAGPHAVEVWLLNDLSAGPGQDRNLYVDGLTFNGQDLHRNATLTANGSVTVSTGAVTRSTPIVVNLSEDAWHGDAQAFIAIDGQVRGGALPVTASHALGQTQAMNFVLDLTPGAHTATVTFLNDASNGPGQDRNLYIDSMDIAGVHYATAAASLSTPGSSTFAFTVAPPTAGNAGLFLTSGLPQPVSVFGITP